MLFQVQSVWRECGSGIIELVVLRDRYKMVHKTCGINETAHETNGLSRGESAGCVDFYPRSVPIQMRNTHNEEPQIAKL